MVPVVGNLRNDRDGIAWQAAIELDVAACQLPRQLPNPTRFALTCQVPRNAVSRPLCISETPPMLTGLFRTQSKLSMSINRVVVCFPEPRFPFP